MKIAICDDSIQDIVHLRENIQAYSMEHEILEFLSADVFLKRIYDGEPFDLLFLDVQMPMADGWEIAQELKRAKNKVFIAMVTIHGEYIFDCFDRVDWFAPKPVSRKKVAKILHNVEERLFPKVFDFQTDKIKFSLAASEIMYLEVKHNTLYIHTVGACYEIRLSLKTAKEMLRECPQFVQIHSSFIVNLAYYEMIKGSLIILKNREDLTLSRTYRNMFFTALNDYVRSQ